MGTKIEKAGAQFCIYICCYKEEDAHHCRHGLRGNKMKNSGHSLVADYCF